METKQMLVMIFGVIVATAITGVVFYFILNIATPIIEEPLTNITQNTTPQINTTIQNQTLNTTVKNQTINTTIKNQTINKLPRNVTQPPRTMPSMNRSEMERIIRERLNRTIIR